MSADNSQERDAAGATHRVQERALVFHVIPQDLNRGAQVYAGNLRDTLRDDEAQEHIVVSLFEGGFGGARPDVALNVPSGVGRRFLDPRVVWHLRRLVRQRGADVLVAHGGEALKYVVAAAGPRPTVYYKVGLSSSAIERPFHRLLYRFLSQRSRLVVGISGAVLDQIGTLFRIPGTKQALIPNGRDPEVYRPIRDGEQPIEPPLLLFVGQLEDGKRPSLFLEALEVLREQGHHFTAALAGEGPLRSRLEQQAQVLGAELLGVRTDVPELMRRSAVVVMTSASDTEGMPGVLIEAGLSGVPAVATAAAGVKDIIDDGRTGRVVGDQPVQIANAVGELLADSTLRMAYGSAARGRCLSRFSLRATADLWRRLIAGIFPETSNPSAQAGDPIGKA